MTHPLHASFYADQLTQATVAVTAFGADKAARTAREMALKLDIFESP